MTLTPSGSNSSDYYEPEDPEFIQALQGAVLPGDVVINANESTAPTPITVTALVAGTEPRATLKRSRSPSEEIDKPISNTSFHQAPAGNEDDTYGRSHFGAWGEYMWRKRAKLQIQNRAQLDGEDDSEKSRIFEGVSIYIDGWTKPSVQDLRYLIIKHGGIFQAYLDKKSIVTHIITCSLTPAKIRDWKHMKIVKPEWLVESVQAGTLLSWKDYAFNAGDRSEEIGGTKVAQKSLLNSFVLQPRVPTPPLKSPTKSSTTHPLFTTDPTTPKKAAAVPSYAAHKSNPNAAKAMANPEWRAANTSVASNYIEGYYKNSRLHHLSTWKSELKDLVIEAQERAEAGLAGVLEGDVNAVEGGVTAKIAAETSESRHNYKVSAAGDGLSMRGTELVLKSPSKGKGKQRAETEEKVIMHCDFDSFFVSAGLVNRPDMKGKPVVVCHSQGGQGGASSTSEIASASYEARAFGIKNGMSLQQARKLCPNLLTIPYEFERYKQISLQFYAILMAHADDLQAVSVDEALIDVSCGVARLTSEQPATPDPAKAFAENIRNEVRKAIGCEVSIGISHNILLARLATKSAKPAGSYHLFQEEVPALMETLDIGDLWGFGWSTRKKAEEKLGVTNLGELAKKSKAVLCNALGKGTGETLYNSIRGVDDRKLESDKPRKSVSCEINYGIRFENNEQAETFIYQLSEEVAKRLDNIDMRGRSLTLKIMKRDPNAPVEPPKFLGHGACDLFNKQTPITAPGGRATSDHKVIGEHAWRLLKSFNFDPRELRGIGIQIQKLEGSNTVSTTEPGQAQLPFTRIEGSTSPSNTPLEPMVVIQPPSDDLAENANDDMPVPGHLTHEDALPSFSQIDQSVFSELPHDIRAEITAEYRHRSISRSPAPPPLPVAGPSRRSESRDLFPKVPAKGSTNVKRIVQQLAPKNRASISPLKNSIFLRRPGFTVTDEELRELDIDPEFFALLPKKLRREQIALARQAKKSGGLAVLVEKTKEFKPIQIRAPKPRARNIKKKPPPQAAYSPQVGIKRPGKQKGEHLLFTETDDIQNIIQAWVEACKARAPQQKDVERFSKFLIQSAGADSGIEKAVGVMKWWLILLRRYWDIWEHHADDDYEEDALVGWSEDREVGIAWWKAFREVKEQVDVVARKRFGGSLSLR